ncbi:MAG: hypothetical protein BK997_01125 [Candidatus Micrarchaeum sp. ARMAN-1]|jgi:hypothetical protein|nr:MAG: hypothetical protein BK997_01125 [Candidatus Micrarchaeum sp. ARMAN-1]
MSVKEAIGNLVYVSVGSFIIFILLFVTSMISSTINLGSIMPAMLIALAIIFHEPLMELLNIDVSI